MDTVALARDRQSSLARLMLFALLASESTLRSATCTISTRRREYRSQSWPIYPHRSRYLFPYCGPPVRLANSFRAPAISSRPPVGSGAARSLGHRAFGTKAKLNCYPPESQVAFVRRLSTTAAQRNQPANPQETRHESGSRQTSRFLVPHLSQAAAGTERTPLYRKDCRKPICPNLLLVLGLETAGLHLILNHWSRTAAWIATALGLYGTVLAAGLYRSLNERPHLLTPESLTLRMGLLSELRVEREQSTRHLAHVLSR